ncbi:hypothetical protein M770_09025 [Pseudomonas aeruginosa VRFPA03]|nr:hypothetical protein M770_09025 [Pseudomonas aeruginosa VRFPA03]
MSNIQIVDLPALPEVEEVCLSDVEDELLLSSQFCNFAWLFLASNNARYLPWPNRQTFPI